MSIASHIPHNVKAASKSLGYALWLDNFQDWQRFKGIIAARLSDQQRAALVFMALRALPPEIGRQTAVSALSLHRGAPVPPLFSAMDEASRWADWASDEELDAYAVATFNRMTPARQRAFLGFIQERAVA